MARINLLPWRVEQRKQRQIQFFIAMGVAVVITGILLGGVHFWMEALVKNQQQRNNYLNQQIAELDRQIRKISDLEKTINNLKKRIDIIQTLQTARPEVVHLFDELVSTLPNGVYLTHMTQKGNVISLKGVAQSNARVSTYMWKLDASDWLSDPDLHIIKTTHKRTGRDSRFTLNITQSRKTTGDQPAGEKKGGKK